jgi:O-acetyl-ADP-ribose deacetylase (regulator of RNase III)
MIQNVRGDILQTPAEYIAQGVAIGSQEGLGTGLALKISQKWPLVQKKFKKYTHANRFQGGDIYVVPPSASNPGVIYIATQPDMYHASLTYLNRGIKELAKYCKHHALASVALPKIGAGLGKLDWELQVKPVLLAHLSESNTIFYVYEDFKIEYEAS